MEPDSLTVVVVTSLISGLLASVFTQLFSHARWARTIKNAQASEVRVLYAQLLAAADQLAVSIGHVGHFRIDHPLRIKLSDSEEFLQRVQELDQKIDTVSTLKWSLALVDHKPERRQLLNDLMDALERFGDSWGKVSGCFSPNYYDDPANQAAFAQKWESFGNDMRDIARQIRDLLYSFVSSFRSDFVFATDTLSMFESPA